MGTAKRSGLPIQLGDVSVIPLVIGYCLCSSLLSIVNKAAIEVFPFPSLLTALQYATSFVTVWIMGRLKILDHDPLVWDKAVKYLPAAIVFYLAIFTNANLLKYANLDTFIVFRSSTPIIVAVADTVFRSQPLPTPYTFASLFLILLGAIGYVLTDNTFTVRAYAWALSYLAVITFEMVYVKHIVHNLGLNTWGFVYYNNLMSLAMAPLFWLVTGEFQQTRSANMSDWLQLWTFIPVATSCAFGLAISFFGFATRRAISATSFTVLGVTNKLLTVVINVMIWDKHSSPFGVFCLLITIFGGVIYQQSVSSPPPSLPPPGKGEEEAELLLQEDKEKGSTADLPHPLQAGRESGEADGMEKGGR